MRYILTPQEMLTAENNAFNSGISPLSLMEKAATGIYEFAKEYNKILVVAGGGNNGGDGFKAASLLKNAGKSVHILFFGKKEKLSPHALHCYNEAASLIVNTPEGDYDLIIDALFGIGFKGTLQGEFLNAVSLINSFKGKAHILAVDVPSGLNSLTGEGENAVNADTTITFQAEKLGHIINRGREHVGNLIIKDIGIEATSQLLMPDKRDVKLAPIPRTAHKGTQGHIGVIAGSLGMEGAAMLASGAAIRTGAGKVTLATDKNILNNLSSRSPEIMVRAIDDVIGFTRDKSVVLFGPGLSRRQVVKEMLIELIRFCTCPLVIDADGLYYLNKELLKEAKCPVIVTPHVAEAARLFEADINTLITSPVDEAKKFSLETGATVLFKSNYNLLVSGEKAYITEFGCEGMSTAGSGDVLAGLVAGGINLQRNVLDGTLLGAYLHGTAGRFAQKEKTAYASVAGDIVNNIHNAFKTLAEG